MTGTDSRGAVVAAARRLFFEHGYKGVTVRDIAAAAGVSPALVIKHHGSKAELFNEVGPHDLPLAELDLPRSAIGRALVRKVLARREHGAPEGWLATTAHVRESPDPDRSRAEVRAKLLDSVGALLGDTTPGRRYASAVSCQMLGLAEGVRVLGMFPEEETSREELLDLYAPLIQQQVDACARARADRPGEP
ncbi:TetR/AcrR family transcriptional regulator [Nocardiopsis sp. HUAS JQ3]|uniref:TetR/AcrR family transcriptional regulator n=1 Tax=Nocardiopsis sp. HUAS JQ3 TaxID=3061629 RepID=UPI0023AA09F2|nr:TetR/AcrR family transcriptional regulator [Nocardiopsis sp. HUAS JQ3]WDZ89430.1 TetR family transcriptional regulator [Nocardiopsis sp. HUAS JQ3]